MAARQKATSLAGHPTDTTPSLHLVQPSDRTRDRTGNTPAKGEAYVPAIDGLRAVAVLSVMIYHLKAGALLGGFVGVDVFFVISGFVVTLSIHKRRFASIGALLAYFYARRLVRIAPALVAMLLITSLLAVAFIPYAWLSDANRTTAFYAFFGLSNVLLAQTADDYFGPRTDFNPFVHTWSLGVEEQFYLIFPLLIGATVLAWSKRGNALSLAVTIALSILSLAACVILSRPDPIFSFFQIPTRFWELGLGAALALSASHWSGRLERWGAPALNAVGLAAIAALLVSFFLCDERHFPFPWALLPVFASAATICVLFTQRPTLVNGLFSSRLFVVIGLLSYSLYLWHWPIYVLLRWTTGLDTLAPQALAVAATFAAAALSYRFVEQPFRKSTFVAGLPRSRAVALLLVVAFAGAVVSRTVFHFNSTLTLSVTKNAPVWSPYDLTVPDGGCAIVTSSQESAAGTVSSISAPCRPGPEHRVFVAGDSHASAYVKLLATLVSQERYVVTVHIRLGCPFLNFRTPSAALAPVCQEFTQATEASILDNVRPGDFVFLPSLRIPRYRDQWGGALETAPLSADDLASATAEARRFLRSVSQHGATVVIEAPTPLFKSPPFRCSDWFNHTNPVCAAGFSIGRSEIEERRAEVTRIAATMAATIPGVTVWDPLPLLCDREQCNAYDDSGPLFFDGDHLSGHGNNVLYRSFAEHLRKNARGNLN
jgi:peptidoglycan/LPS O-acetylase OafA/YrhL